MHALTKPIVRMSASSSANPLAGGRMGGIIIIAIIIIAVGIGIAVFIARRKIKQHPS